MVIYKFGGASVKDADAVRNLGQIIGRYQGDLIIVISAMGKTTQALEELVNLYFNSWYLFESSTITTTKPGKSGLLKPRAANLSGWESGRQRIMEQVDAVYQYHYQIVEQLFPDKKLEVYDKLDFWFKRLEHIVQLEPSLNYDFEYDKIVAHGELVSTTIVSEYLNYVGKLNEWVDIRKCLKTGDFHRDAKIDWQLSHQLIHEFFVFKKNKVYVTQGFIGATINNHTTTLGREGSDFTASILAYILEAENVTIWKDVDGVYNADPKWLGRTERLEKISYLEAIEQTYYGAKVIHPKTIKPLENKKIPLYVKSFVIPESPGTLIHSFDEWNRGAISRNVVPVFIRKINQVLVAISPIDFSFIAEDNLSKIFAIFAKYRTRTNLMQNSAVSFMACFDYDFMKTEPIIDELGDEFVLNVTKNLTLITIRHYNDEVINRIIGNSEVIVRQLSENSARFVIADYQSPE